MYIEYSAESFYSVTYVNINYSVKYSNVDSKYRTRAIITRGLYTFYPIFHCGLYSKAAIIADNLCTKKWYFFKKVCGL